MQEQASLPLGMDPWLRKLDLKATGHVRSELREDGISSPWLRVGPQAWHLVQDIAEGRVALCA